MGRCAFYVRAARPFTSAASLAFSGRYRVGFMHTTIAAGALALLVFTAGAAAQQKPALEPGAEELLAHRAVYDLQLAPSAGSRAIEAAQGRLVMEFSGSACTGYETKFRQVARLETRESDARTIDLTSSTDEAGDGSRLRFRSVLRTGAGPDKVVEGEASNTDGRILISFKIPKGIYYMVPVQPVFPTAQMKRVIAAALAGQTTLELPLFDGSSDGITIYDTLAIIGARAEPAAADAAFPLLANGRPWPVTLSYFKYGQRGERTPEYVLSFLLYDNGVSTRLKIDYGDFALVGALSQIETLEPAQPCAR